ncbi:TolC family protein [Maribacter sp. M208]|uniref:TolC family protein n=1 Tax=Maribacter huludaoensis TaxID=3030010 RepID=UPI0023EBB7EC|nr:TolC family protein [Maribacter huludaoensis]MDF4221308.1 TolC family protein [Maribacter huludaoensis]
MKVKITGLLLLCSVVMGMAQQKKWTLEECVAYAVENNLTIEQLELDLATVKIDKSDAVGAFLPNLNLSSGVSERSGLVVDPNSNANVSGTIFSVTPGITTGVTLFDGLQNIHRLNRAKLNTIASQFRLDDLKDDIRLSVANSYLQILSNKEALEVAKAQYAVTEQDLKRTKELVDSGVVPRVDLLEIQATAATQEQQIVNNEGLILISKISLAQILQITDYANFEIADEEFNIPLSDILNNSAKDIFSKALEFRNDIKVSESNVAIAEKDQQIAKGALYPTINAFFNYNTFYTNQFAPVPDPNNPGQFLFDPNNQGTLLLTRESITNQFYLNDGISYGFQINVPVFNGFSVKNNIKRAAINLESSKLQLEQDKLALEAEIQQAYVNVSTFLKSYEAAEKTLEATTLAFEYSKERFDVGLMNAFEYSQAQSRIDNAKADVIRTKYDYIFRLKILEFYFGIPISLE